MAEVVTKPVYVMVTDEMTEKKKKGEKEPFRYTRGTLQSTLQLMGCKPRHAFKISQRVFELIRGQSSSEAIYQAAPLSSSDASMRQIKNENDTAGVSLGKEVGNDFVAEKDEEDISMPFELYKRRTTVVVRRATFLDVVCKALAEYKYVGPNQRADLALACRIRERKESVIVLLCGTSGCGKSTLSALLGSRLGITSVVSTDSIRHMMRSFVDEKENPLLWASTYHAGEYLDSEAVAAAKAKKKAKKLAGVSHSTDGSAIEKSDGLSAISSTTERISPKQMAIEGFKAQSEMVTDSLDRLITAWEEKKESVVVEGVHLSLNFVMGLMKKHPSVMPFMVYIANEEKHMERFAVRAKYMTLDPSKNRYIKYIRNIRAIQEYLCNRADKHLVPKINNTNVDKSVAAIHATVFSCLRRRAAGEQLYDPVRNTVTVVDEEYRNQCVANSLTSKGVFQLIQRKGSSRNLMALLNTDGSVAKTWPLDAVDTSDKGTDKGLGDAMYGPVQIAKAEPVNLQFGHFGVSAWPTDGATSHAGSYDEHRPDWADIICGNQSTCCSSPRLAERPSKELKEDTSVDGSDGEADDSPEPNSDLSDSDDADKEDQEQEEIGSVDESTKSDEEYDDLAMLDIQENGDCSEDESKDNPASLPGVQLTDMQSGKHTENFKWIIRTGSEQLPEALCLQSSLDPEKKKQYLSIPVMENHGTFLSDPILPR